MFSVVVPVYNHRRYVLPSLLSALASPDVAEVLVMDDGSSDGSAHILRDLRPGGVPRLIDLTPTRRTNRGAPFCLNHLCAAASAEWIAVLNSDDLLVPGRFFHLRHALRTDADPGDFYFGPLLVIDHAGGAIGKKDGPLSPEYPFPAGLCVDEMMRAGKWLELLANQNYIATTSNMVFTKDLWARLGGFRDYRYVHDWDFALRACVLGEPRFLPFPLTSYRLHAANTIKESATRVDAEVQEVFRDLLENFPGLLDRPLLRAALAGNRHVPFPDELLSGPGKHRPRHGRWSAAGSPAAGPPATRLHGSGAFRKAA